MVKGLRSPEALLLDLMRTYSASPWQTFWKLRWPSAVPYLFASMKVALAISLVGAIVGALPTGAVAGLGARLLAGSYYGQRSEEPTSELQSLMPISYSVFCLQKKNKYSVL